MWQSAQRRAPLLALSDQAGRSTAFGIEAGGGVGDRLEGEKEVVDGLGWGFAVWRSRSKSRCRVVALPLRPPGSQRTSSLVHLDAYSLPARAVGPCRSSLYNQHPLKPAPRATLDQPTLQTANRPQVAMMLMNNCHPDATRPNFSTGTTNHRPSRHGQGTG